MKIKWNSEQIPKMNVKNNKDVTFLTYPAYEEMNWLVHGFSTRFGGVSRGIYSSMNLSFTRGDEESCVKENYRRISDAMGFDMNSIVTSDQTHTNNVSLDYIYTSFHRKDLRPVVILQTEDGAVTECILKNNGFNVFTSAEELEK